jgi:EAL domain-containing protein (putative c-di-GMP-specific phosphodiesterase class I)
MYHAKSAGRRRWATFDGELRRAAVTRQQMEHGLRRALERDELSLEFQPVARLDDMLVVGAECLLRWTSHGVAIEPGEFIPVAEDNGLIGPIGLWVLGGALAELDGWDRSGQFGSRSRSLPMGMAVNVSVRQLQSPGFVHHVAEILNGSGSDPARVTLEITETVLLEELTTTGDVLGELKGLGVNIALDDFGTGYSPLTYLKDLPIDEVKLDRSFVAKVGTDQGARAIASAVINLAEATSLRVVAEGIETDLERRVLRDLGCRFGQGSLISGPVAGEALPEAVRRIEAPTTPGRGN